MKAWLSLVLLLFYSSSWAVIERAEEKEMQPPENLKIPASAIPSLLQQFVNADPVGKIAITRMIASIDSPKKYDALRFILLQDQTVGFKYAETKFTAPIECRMIAAEELGKSHDPKYVEVLLDILRYTKSWDLKFQCATALGELGSKDAVVGMVDLIMNDFAINSTFEENNPIHYNKDRVVRLLVKAIGKIGDPRGLKALLWIVTTYNYSDATISEAWKAMANLKWR